MVATSSWLTAFAGVLASGLLASTVQADGSLGSWEVIGESPVLCIHSILLPNGKLLCIERPREFPYAENNLSNGRTVAELGLMGENGVTATYHDSNIPEVYENAFCGHHAQMANGSILVVGGDQRQLFEAANGSIEIYDPLVSPQVNPNYASEGGTLFLSDGAKGRRLFDPCAEGDSDCKAGTWTQLPDMSTERWYPSLITLSDGTFFIVSGSHHNLDMENFAGNNNPTYEYWPERGEPKELDVLNWAFPHSLYPQAYVLPSGNIFLFVSNKTVIIDPVNDITSESPDWDGLTIPDLNLENHSPWLYPHMPASLVLPMTQANNWNYTLMFCGGSEGLQNLTSATPNSGEVNDAADPRPAASDLCAFISPEGVSNPQWTTDTMPHRRLMADTVLLPDGTVLFLNGAAWGQAGGNGGQCQYAGYPVFETDLYDPTKPEGQRWSTLASASISRLYHSGALLLPSGHVISTGSEMQNYVDWWKSDNGAITPDANCWPASDNVCTLPFETRIERFAPPYLDGKSDDDRLSIDSVSSDVITYQSIFKITAGSDSKNVKRVTSTRYGTATHQLNMDQRFYELPIVGRKGNDIYVEAPMNSSLAPPGNWFLWLLDSDNIPSPAKTVKFNLGDINSVDVPKDANTNGGSRTIIVTSGLSSVFTAFALGLVCMYSFLG